VSKWVVTRTMKFLVDADDQEAAEFAANHLDEYDAFKTTVKAVPDDGKETSKSGS
jgi:hypothetical protein